MSNTNITNIQVSDTFQVWFNTTNELVSLINENVMLAGPGPGFTVSGNSTLQGTFTADQIISSNGSIDDLSVSTLEKSGIATEQIISNSPIKIQSSVENIFDLQTSAGSRPILRMVNGGNARWIFAPLTSSANSSIGIGTEGSATPQVVISQDGTLTANRLQGDGSLITNLNITNIPNIDASKITSGVLDLDRIPDLPASKITSGIFNIARIPNIDASKITSGIIANERLPTSASRGEITLENLINPNSSVQGFITGRRFRSALTWDNISEKPEVFPPAPHTHELDASEIATGVIANERLPASATRGEITLANLVNASSAVQGFITGRRFRSALTWGNISGRPATFPPSNHTHTINQIIGLNERLNSIESGTGGVGDLPASATRGEITLANLTNENSTVQGFITGRRFVAGVNNVVGPVTRTNSTNFQFVGTQNHIFSFNVNMERAGEVLVWAAVNPDSGIEGNFVNLSRYRAELYLNNVFQNLGFIFWGPNLNSSVLYGRITANQGANVNVQVRFSELRSVRGVFGNVQIMRLYR